MDLEYTTARLSVSEIGRDSKKTHCSDLLLRITQLLSPEVVEYLPQSFHNINTCESAQFWLKAMVADSRLLIVRSNEPDAIVGFVFIFVDYEYSAQIGYLLGGQYWGQGLASELLNGFLVLAENRQEWRKIVGGVDAANRVSSKLLRKLGFVQQPDSTGPVVFYEYDLA